jgi:HEXXH motif-containing protein
MDLEALFCTPFETDQIQRLSAQRRDYRVRDVRRLLPTNRANGPALPEDRWALIDAYFAALSALLAGAPERGAALLDHWAPSFYLHQFMADKNASPAAVEQAASNLFAMMLFERLGDGTSPLKGLSFVTRADSTGAIHVFSQDARVRLAGLSRPNARLHWECDERSATVWPMDAEDDPIELPLPLPEGAFERAPFDRVPGLDIPVLEDCWAALMRTEDVPEYGAAARSPDHADWRPIPLRESLTETHRTLSELWPEVISWVKLFIPAVVQVPHSADQSIRLSGGLYAGAPIYLSRVADPYLHGEDLVHELQHARLLLLCPVEEYFASFREAPRLFVSPFRPDPRPLFGLHLGLHAFIAVSELQVRALRAGRRGASFFKNMLRTHRMNLFSYRTIMANEQFSPEGRRFYEEIARVLSRHHREIEPLVAPMTAAQVEAALEEHRARVLESGAPIANSRIPFGPATAEELGATGQGSQAALAEVRA